MIGKVSVGNSFGGIVNYLLNEKKNPEILDSNGVMLESKESIIDSFNYQRSMNRNLGKAVWHSSISFAYLDSVDNNIMKLVANDYIHEIGLSDTQFLVVKHNDRQHKHLHILANRVDNSGDTVSDSFAANRTVKIMQSLEKSYDLTVAKESENQSKKELKDTIKEAIESGNTLEQVFAKVEKIGYEILLNKDKNNKITGVSYSKKSKGFILKASQVDRSLSYLKMGKLIENVARRNEAFKATKLEPNQEIQVLEETPSSNQVYSNEKILVEFKSSEINEVSDVSEKAKHNSKTGDSETIQDKQAKVVHSEKYSVEASNVTLEEELFSTDLSIHGSSITTGVVPNIEENSSFKNIIDDHTSPKETEKIPTVEDSNGSGENSKIEKKSISEEIRREEGLFQTSFIEDLEGQQSSSLSEGTKGEDEMFDNALSIKDIKEDTPTNQIVERHNELVDAKSENGGSKEILKEPTSENKRNVEAIKPSTDFSKSIDNEDLEYSRREGVKESVDPKTADVNKKEEAATNQLLLFGQEERKEEVIKGFDVPANSSFEQGEVSKQKPDEQQEVIKSIKDEIIKTTIEPDKKPGESELDQKENFSIIVKGKVEDSLEANKTREVYDITDKSETLIVSFKPRSNDRLPNKKPLEIKAEESIKSEKAYDKPSQLEKSSHLNVQGNGADTGHNQKVMSSTNPVKASIKRNVESLVNSPAEPRIVQGNQFLSNKIVNGVVSEIQAVGENSEIIKFKLTCSQTQKEYSCSVPTKKYFEQLLLEGFQNGGSVSVGNLKVSILKVPRFKKYKIYGTVDAVFKHESKNLLVINIVDQNGKNSRVWTFEGDEAKKFINKKIRLGSKISASVTPKVFPKEVFGFNTFKVKNFRIEKRAKKKYRPFKVLPKMFDLFIDFLDLMAYMNDVEQTNNLSL